MAHIEANLLDWNGKLHVVNGSPLSTPYPRDREFWAISGDGEPVCVRFWPHGSKWAGSDLFIEVQNPDAAHAGSDIQGWTDNHADAEEAAAMLVQLLDCAGEA